MLGTSLEGPNDFIYVHFTILLMQRSGGGAGDSVAAVAVVPAESAIAGKRLSLIAPRHVQAGGYVNLSPHGVAKDIRRHHVSGQQTFLIPLLEETPGAICLKTSPKKEPTKKRTHSQIHSNGTLRP